MTPDRLTAATPAELTALSDMCLRSKGVWGYDAAFLEACRAELTLTRDDLADWVAVTRQDGRFTGLVHLSQSGQSAEIERLFVDPDCIGQGLGRSLMHWATDIARGQGAMRLRIEADPGAVPFYQAMGAVRTGQARSGSIPGRTLPVLHLTL